MFDAVEIGKCEERLCDYEYEVVTLTALHKLSYVSCVPEAYVVRVPIPSLLHLNPSMSLHAVLCDSPDAI